MNATPKWAAAAKSSCGPGQSGNRNCSRIKDAAANLGRAVAGLPPEEAARIVGDAVRIAVLRAADARTCGPQSPNGS
jgi:hypothetical protein